MPERNETSERIEAVPNPKFNLTCKVKLALFKHGHVCKILVLLLVGDAGGGSFNSRSRRDRPTSSGVEIVRAEGTELVSVDSLNSHSAPLPPGSAGSHRVRLPAGPGLPRSRVTSQLARLCTVTLARGRVRRPVR